MENKKKFGLVQILELIKSGLNPSQISKKYNIPKQTLGYSVDKLKKLGCIQKVGYGVWEYIKPLKEVPILTTRQSNRSKQKVRTSNPKKEIRGHAFIWKIQFIEHYDWARAVKKYNKKTLKFQLLTHNKVIRTVFQNRKIWLGTKGMTIYEPLDFFGKSSFEVKGRAVYEMDFLIKNLLRELGLKFKPYRFTTSREHYGLIKNELARQYNDRKEKLRITSEDGTVWMWIDDSLGLGELENAKPNISRQVQNYWNNHKKHNFDIDADFILNGFNEQNKAIKANAEHLEYHVENMRSHIKAVRDLGEGVKKWQKITANLLRISEMLEKRLGEG